MELVRVIRETLEYSRQYRESTVAIIVDSEIGDRVRQLGIVNDIHAIRQAGINVVIFHSNPKLNLKRWKIFNSIVREAESHNIEKIKTNLRFGTIIVVPCYEINGLSPNEIAVNVAVAIKATKLIFLTTHDGIFERGQKLVREADISYARKLLLMPKIVTGKMREMVEAGIAACEQGVDRIHIISGIREGALLREIFSCEGVGTMFYSRMPYQEIRKAQTKDIFSILEILIESIDGSTFELSEIDSTIENFLVFSVDGDVHGCAHMKEYVDQKVIEVSHVAVSRSYENSDVLKRVMNHIINYGKQKGVKKIFLQLEKNVMWLRIFPWFVELGFTKTDVKNLIPSIPSSTKAWLCSLQA